MGCVKTGMSKTSFFVSNAGFQGPMVILGMDPGDFKDLTCPEILWAMKAFVQFWIVWRPQTFEWGVSCSQETAWELQAFRKLQSTFGTVEIHWSSWILQTTRCMEKLGNRMALALCFGASTTTPATPWCRNIERQFPCSWVSAETTSTILRLYWTIS